MYKYTYLSISAASDEELNQTISWPRGAYGLPKANGGCPEGSWNEGWCIISTLNNTLYLPEGQRAAHMYGWVTNEDKDIAMHFCMKGEENTGSSSRDTPLWPSGTYCILQNGESCPSGFKTSSYPLMWGDVSPRGGCTPDVQHYDYHLYRKWYIVIHRFRGFNLCCRSDGNISTPVDLPHQHSFILLANLEQLQPSPRASSRPCQEVKGMQVEPEVINSTFSYDVINSFVPSWRSRQMFVLCYYSPLGGCLCAIV